MHQPIRTAPADRTANPVSPLSLRAAACEMAELLERQSAHLRRLGQRALAAEACLEVRQLRLLAAIGG